jgi:hypothetical protein
MDCLMETNGKAVVVYGEQLKQWKMGKSFCIGQKRVQLMLKNSLLLTQLG